MMRPSIARLRARGYFADLGAFERDAVGNASGYSFRHCSSRVFGFEDEHRKPVAPVFGASPISANEAWRLRDAWNDELLQPLLRSLSVVDRDSYDHCMHGGPSSRSIGTSLGGAALSNNSTRQDPCAQESRCGMRGAS